MQTGLDNPLDEAIVAAATQVGISTDDERKVDEIPYDFVRKCLSVVSTNGSGGYTLITKGALANVVERCDAVETGGGRLRLDATFRTAIARRHADWSGQGYRVLGVATKDVDDRTTSYSPADEQGLAFCGFLLFMDPPKTDVRATVSALGARGVGLKIITGDNAEVAKHVAQSVGLPVDGVLTGRQMSELRDEALWHQATRTTIFAEVDPNQKERIILALQHMGHVVGYMGDGINDAPALHAADVGLSVDTAVDVAKEAADFVLLRKDLDILCDGIDEGRRTFANTLKYILTTVSANFGNMFSMAGASLLLPFLPLLAPQILLNNFLSDIPAAGIAGDHVDPEWVAKPRRWDATFIRNYMVLFGLVSSLFDFLTFAVLLVVFRAAPPEFRTGWFLESLLTELVIALVVRTRRRFFESRPSPFLLWSSVALMGITLAFPYLPWRAAFSFVPLPLPLLLSLIGLTVLYVGCTEAAKRYFYSRPGHS
ncbi:MAG: HAD-IC family P-type ATPase [Gemmatimonadaceae bacterium]